MLQFVRAVTVCLLLLATTALIWALAQEPPDTAHDWQNIDFPVPPGNSDESPTPRFNVGNRHKDGLEFVVRYTFAANAEDHPKLPNAEQMTVRLHCADGKIVSPQPNLLRGPVGIGDARAMSYIYLYRFLWQRNALDEAWIELRLPGQTYWLELPYGFTRDPAAPLTLQENKRGEPSLAAGMKALGKSDQIVSWLYVQYDLGEIQKHWRLSVNFANPFDAMAEVLLYRDDTEVGKSSYLWDLHEPRTAISIRRSDSTVLSSMARCIRLEEGGHERSDSFYFNRDPSDDRCWGTATVTVEDKPYTFVVPSSLFRYVHGTAEHGHKARVPRQGDRWPYRPG